MRCPHLVSQVTWKTSVCCFYLMHFYFILQLCSQFSFVIFVCCKYIMVATYTLHSDSFHVVCFHVTTEACYVYSNEAKKTFPRGTAKCIISHCIRHLHHSYMQTFTSHQQIPSRKDPTLYTSHLISPFFLEQLWRNDQSQGRTRGNVLAHRWSCSQWEYISF